MNTTAQNTLIAVFRDQASAQSAIKDLDAAGFTSHETYDTAGTGDANVTRHGTHEGGIVGWFKSLFGDEDNENTQDYSRYQSAVQSGGVAVSVQADADSLDRAIAILNSHSPVTIQNEDEENRDQYATNTAAANTAATAGTAAAGTTAGRRTAAGTTSADTAAGTKRNRQNTEAIPVIREELQVGKRVVQRGGVRIYTRVINEPVEEKIRLREETVRVDRTPVNREATAADLQPGREQVYEVKEFREEPVVSKQARVVEEVRIAKEANERVDTVLDTVRRTEVDVQNLSDTGTERYRDQVDAGLEGTGSAGYESDPAYAYGSTVSRDPRYTGRSWDDVENDLRTDYSTRYPNSKWDQVKASVRRGWDKVSAKAHGA